MIAGRSRNWTIGASCSSARGWSIVSVLRGWSILLRQRRARGSTKRGQFNSRTLSEKLVESRRGAVAEDDLDPGALGGLANFSNVTDPGIHELLVHLEEHA